MPALPPLRNLSAAQARRLAVSSQQLQGSTSLKDKGGLRRMVDRLGLLQIDSVSVLARAHYLPLHARAGNYDVDILDQAAWPANPRKRLLVESWAHEASLIPVTTEPLLRWRCAEFADGGKWRSARELLARSPGLVDAVLAVIAERGPSSAGEVEEALEGRRRGAGWWQWSDAKIACEYLFAIGALGVAHRRSFTRLYDRIENVLPAEILATSTPEPADARRELVRIAVRAHGVGTTADFSDYFRLPVAATKAALLDLVDTGEVVPVAVDGWSEPGWMKADAVVPRAAQGSALLCPFDPLVWFRRRTERLFDFHYRIEIYTPADKRIHGYYVFPLLVGDRLVGRFDLKADRATGRLLVASSWLEPGHDVGVVLPAAHTQLRLMADWLGLETVVVSERGTLAEPLRRYLGGSASLGA